MILAVFRSAICISQTNHIYINIWIYEATLIHTGWWWSIVGGNSFNRRRARTLIVTNTSTDEYSLQFATQRENYPSPLFESCGISNEITKQTLSPCTIIHALFVAGRCASIVQLPLDWMVKSPGRAQGLKSFQHDALPSRFEIVHKVIAARKQSPNT